MSAPYPTSTTQHEHDFVSPQATGVSPQLGSVSPQITGITASHPPSADQITPANPHHEMEGLQAVNPPSYANEKGAQPQQQEAMHAQPQQGYAAAHPEQGHFAPEVQQKGPGTAPRSTYQMATPLPSLQQGPTPVDCPVCGVREMTRTEYVSGGTAHLSAAVLCCCLCLGCIPYLASWFKDCEHKCGNCGALLAVWHRSGRTEVMAHARA